MITPIELEARIQNAEKYFAIQMDKIVDATQQISPVNEALVNRADGFFKHLLQISHKQPHYLTLIKKQHELFIFSREQDFIVSVRLSVTMQLKAYLLTKLPKSHL